MMKRILSFLLAFLMVVSIFPAQAFATDNTDVTITPTETPTEAATETPCGTCGQLGCTSEHLNWCADCQKDDCGQNHCDTCGAIDCTTEHKICDKCGTLDCTADHTNWCADCKVDNCGQNHCPTCRAIDCTTDHGAPAAETPEEPEVHPMVGKVVKLKSDLTSYSGYRGENLSMTLMSKGGYPSVMKVTAVLEKNDVVYCRLAAVEGSWSFPEYDDNFYLESTKLEAAVWCTECEKYDCGVDHTQPTDPTEPENPCGCCETCTGEEGCTCHCGSCQFCEKEPEDELVDGPIYGTINGQTITVSGTLPQDVTVNVAPADVSQQLAQFDIPADKLVFGLDISLRKDGADYQPGSGTKVKVPVTAAPGTKIGILHTHNGETTYLCLTEVLSDGTVEFNTNGFSQFAGFTVDFHYNGIDYSIAGLTSITLSELFTILEIDRQASNAASVVFSDTSLIKVTKTDGDWLLESLKAFETEETLEITFYDGEIIVIDVTDGAYPYRDKFKNHNSANDAYRNGEGTATARPYKAFSAVPGVNCNWSVWGGGARQVYLYLYDTNGSPVDYSHMTYAPDSSGWFSMDGNYWYEVTDFEFTWPDNDMSRPLGSGNNTLSVGYCGASKKTINWVEIRMYSLDVWDNKSYCDVNQVSKFALDESGETGYRTVVIYAENNEVGRTSVYMPTFESISTSDLTVSPYAGWTHEKTTVSGSTYSVYLKRVSYTITYTLNGGQVNTSNPTTYNVETNTFTLNNPTKNGYTFTGWTGTDLSSASTTVTISKGSTGDRSYTANWTEKPYTITYYHDYTDEKGNQVISTEGYTITSTSGLLNPTRRGYEFLGWKLETGLTPPNGNWTADTYSAGTPVTGKYGDVTLVAQWKSTGNSLTYAYTGEHTPTDTSCTLPEEAIVTPDTEVTVFIPTAIGYTFSGWTPSVTSVQITEGKFQMPDEAVVLTGSWTPIQYKITYDYNNGDGTNPPKKVEETYTIEDAVKLMAAPAKADVPTDFRFTGWKLAQSVTAPNGNWTAGTFQAEQQFQEGRYGNITLVAQWERAAKDLTIQANSTDSDVNFVYTISGQGITITVAVPANSSVTIKSMPVGDYTITEKTAWSWRHTENYGNHSVTITKTEEEQSVVFEYNGNENKLWLNGYSYGKKGG